MLIVPACAALVALLVSRLAFWCASPRSAPQQAAAWAAQLGGVGACAYQALRLQLLLRHSTAQEQVAVLQWLVACATQWVVLEQMPPVEVLMPWPLVLMPLELTPVWMNSPTGKLMPQTLSSRLRTPGAAPRRAPRAGAQG